MTVLLATLAVWRLAYLLARERGPADVVSRLHVRLHGTAVGEALACVHCTAAWLALPMAVVIAEGPGPVLLHWAALAGGASLLQRWWDGPPAALPFPSAIDAPTTEGVGASDVFHDRKDPP